MKQVVFHALAAGLILGAGCSKKEDPAPAPVQTAPKETSATQAAPMTFAQMSEKATAVAAKAQAVTKEASRTMNALTVTPEQVLAELDQPVADIKAKAAGYGQPELLATVNAYKDMILAKKDQLAGLSTQLKGLGMTDMLGEKGAAIKNQLTQYTSQLAGLKERYGVYLDMLKKFGVDLSSFGL